MSNCTLLRKISVGLFYTYSPKSMGDEMKVAIIGTGTVGTSIGSALLGKKYEVVYGSRKPQSAKVPKGAAVRTQVEAVNGADVVFLAVPYLAVKDTVESIGPGTFSKKTVVDVTNVLDKNFGWAVGFSTSGAEELAKLIPGANVVKAFNTMSAAYMGTANMKGERLPLFVAGDSDEAKASVKEMGAKIGFDVIDAGQLKAARLLEALGMLNIHLGYNQKIGEFAIRVVR